MEAWIIILVIVILTELLMSGGWLPFYFRAGIPLFRRSFRFFEQPAISADNLAAAFTGGFLEPIIFHSISPQEIGFREKFWGLRLSFSYTAIMHGLIRIDNSQHEVSVTGYANWYILCLIAIIISYGLSSFGNDFWNFDVTLFLLLFFLFLYFIQFSRFTKIFRYLENEYSPYFRQGKKGSGSNLHA
jgi:hypothetical protein